MPLTNHRLIVVEGPIGAGKTSLARRLAEHLGGETLLENPDDNPFLPKYYEDPEHYALQAQLFFLFQRINQLRDLKQMDLFSRPTVLDYMLEKDALFARLTLSDQEYALYQELFRHLRIQAPRPDLVIYLQAPVEALLERVRRRGVGYERNLEAEYLQRLTDSYAQFFYHYDASPLLIVNSENLNFVDNDDDFRLLLRCIADMRGAREFFNRG